MQWYNCYLNVIVQILWNQDALRNAILSYVDRVPTVQNLIESKFIHEFKLLFKQI